MFRHRRLAAVLALGTASAMAQTPAPPFVPKSTKSEPLTMTGLGGAAPKSPVFSPKVSKTEPLTMTGLGGGTPPGGDKPFTARSAKTEPLTMTGAGK